MTQLPTAYGDLSAEIAPRMLLEMLALYGTLEAPGAADNPVIMAWAKEAGVAGYTHDSVPWCGLTMALAAKRADYTPPENPPWALNWMNFGHAAQRPMLGDVMVKERDGGGHVTMYVGEDADCYHCLGGNQSDSVNITRIPRAAFKGFRRPNFRVGQPAAVRVIRRSAAGASMGTKEV